MHRLKTIWKGSWPTVVGATVLVIFALLVGASWPTSWHIPPAPPPPRNPTPWITFLTFFLASFFLCIKSTIMLQRMGRPIDWLTISLVAVNFSFALLYLVALGRPMFPEFVARHRTADAWGTLILQVHLVALLIWGVVAIVNTPPGTGYYVIKEPDH